ncbi:MAG: DegV family EDD domain-containing protein [Mycoplasmataceae bacterium]|nr:DegV family EDD domain-containing protein [Mycoplasmataceae bacterium]
MNDWGIVVDSACGKTKKWIEDNGWYFVPYKIFYDNKEYDDGINIETKEIKLKIDKGTIGKTSVPSVETIKEKYREGLLNNKKLIVLSLSEKVSGMNNAFRLAAEEDEFKGKIKVVKSKLFTPWMTQILEIVSKYKKNNMSFDKVLKWIEKANKHTSGIMILKDLKFLGSSGRVSSSQARLGSIVGIKPTLSWIDGSIDKDSSIKARNYKKAVVRGLEIIKSYIESNKIDTSKYAIGLAYNQVDEDRKKTVQLIKDNINDIDVIDYKNFEMLGVSMVHIGYDITGFGLFLKEEK